VPLSGVRAQAPQKAPVPYAIAAEPAPQGLPAGGTRAKSNSLGIMSLILGALIVVGGLALIVGSVWLILPNAASTSVDTVGKKKSDTNPTVALNENQPKDQKKINPPVDDFKDGANPKSEPLPKQDSEPKADVSRKPNPGKSNDQKAKPDSPGIPDTKPKNQTPAVAKEPEWTDASKDAVQHGEVSIRVKSISINSVAGKVNSYVTGKVITASVVTQDQFLIIRIAIENPSDTRIVKVAYDGWGRGLSDRSRLKDNFGNEYIMRRPRIKMYGNIFSDEFQADGQFTGSKAQPEQVYPGKSITDVLLFDFPVDRAEFLRLELPASTIGGSGTLRFQIPASMIVKKG